MNREPTLAPPPVQVPAAAPRVEPQVAEPASVIVTPPPPAKAPRRVFAGERADGPDALGIDETLGHLAELALHKGTAGPLAIGLVGGPGSGKSFALARLAARIRELAAAATRAEGPFVSRVHVETIDAAALEGAPALALAARLYAGLQKTHPELAREIAASARDPHAALRAGEEKLDEARRRLDAERRALDEAGARRARLTETVLYEAAGSQIDAYARANRAGIESRLTSFGIFGDAIRNYKDLVQLASGSGSSMAGLAMRSLWAYKGQLKLLVAAVLLVGVGIGLGVAIDGQATWLEAMRGGPKAGGAVADWLQEHIGLLSTAKAAAYLLALGAIVVNLWRAVGFLRLILKGKHLLESDLESRRHDLDGLCAHQTKRVDALEAAVERLTGEVAEAERRAGGTGARHEPSPFEPAGAPAKAQDVFAALAAAMAAQPKAPQRVVLALDHLDALTPDRARAILDALHRSAGPGMVTIVGADVARLDPGGTRRAEMERWIQVPFRLDASVSADTRLALVQEALGERAMPMTPATLDARRSDLDATVAEEEASLLAALSDLAGRTPRGVKRFANLYRLARLGDERPLGPLAFMLAVTLGGNAGEQQAVVDAAAGDASAPFQLSNASPRVQAAFNAAVALGGRFTRGEAEDAAQRAAAFSL